MKSSEKDKMIIFILASLTLLFLPYSFNAQPSGCDGCSRTAVLGNTRLNDPMGLTSPDVFRTSVFSRIAELVTSPCFHLGGSEADRYSESLKDANYLPGYGSERKSHEYTFESELVSGLNETGPDGRPVRSRWTITLWFEGNQRELVHSWQTLGTQEKKPSSPTERNTGTTFSGHGNKMTELFRDGPGITEIIEKFEKRPVSCLVGPEKEEVSPSEIIEIRITDFRDKYGQKSREFNRIIVHADNGDISNGDDCDIGPDYKVFTMKDGTVRVRYKALDNCSVGTDNIKIYSTCEILPESIIPLSKTTINEEIAVRKINIVCYDAVLVLTAKRQRTRNTSNNGSSQPDPNKNCRTSWSSNSDLSEQTEATVRIPLNRSELSNATIIKNPMVNQTMLGFTPVRAELTKFIYTYNESSFSRSETTGSDCRNTGSESSKSVSRSVEGQPDVRFVAVPNSVILTFDPKTNKALKFGSQFADVVFKYSETTNSHSRLWPTDAQPQSKTSTVIKGSDFEVEPVGDFVPDPYPLEISYSPVIDSIARLKEKFKGTMPEELLSMLPELDNSTQNAKSSSKIQSDHLVTKGDGKTSFGGEGRKTKEKKLKDGSEKEDLYFSWQLTLNKK
jgi:hypothetical protein